MVKCVSGYAGGELENPSYEDVKTGNTGHAEVVQVTYDPSVITFEEILTVFFKIHNPTSLNKQGGDKGTQYRSTIMYHSEQHLQIIEKSIETEQMNYMDGIVTVVEPLPKLWEAEDYH